MKGKSVALTVLSTLWSVFPLIPFLNSSISFLISWRRSELCSSRVVGLRWSLLLWLSPSSSKLPLDWFSSYWSRCFISWFCLVSSSTVAARAWICWANAVESWLDSIWMLQLIKNYVFESEYGNVSPHRRRQTDEAWLHQSNWTCPNGSKFLPGYLCKWEDYSFLGGHRCGACHNVSDAQVKKRKCFVKRKQNSRITMNVYLYTLCWWCVGFLYVALDYSRCGRYCGVNAFLGNAFCLVIGLQYPFNALYNWFCNRLRYY